MIENDDIFEALAGRRRRELLVSLVDADPQYVAPLSDESRELAEANGAFLREFLSSSREMDDVDKDMVRLHHVDLPLLVRFSYVTWTASKRTVSKGPRFEELVPVLELLKEDRTSDVTTISAPTER